MNERTLSMMEPPSYSGQRECVISMTDIVAEERHFPSIYILSRLREAGIPVIGLLAFTGLESGTLHQIPEGYGAIRYVWRDDAWSRTKIKVKGTTWLYDQKKGARK